MRNWQVICTTFTQQRIHIMQKSIRTAANLTVTLLTHYVALKLETILDRETKISHEQFATQIEARLGSGEGETAKGPDMKVWGKGRGINDVSYALSTRTPVS